MHLLSQEKIHLLLGSKNPSEIVGTLLELELLLVLLRNKVGGNILTGKDPLVLVVTTKLGKELRLVNVPCLKHLVLGVGITDLVERLHELSLLD